MDGACRAFAAPGLVEIAGEEYRCWPFTVGHWAEIGQILICERPSAAAMARRYAHKFRDVGLEGNLINVAIAQTRRDLYVTHNEANDYRDSMEGLAFRLWCQLRENDPRALTRKAVRTLFWSEYERVSGTDGATAAEDWAWNLRERLVTISGEDDRANLEWPPPSKMAQALEEALTSRGQYNPIPWRRILRDFAEAYGFAPEQVGRMTLYQVKMLSYDRKCLGGVQFRGASRSVGGASKAWTMGTAAAARQAVKQANLAQD